MIFKDRFQERIATVILVAIEWKNCQGEQKQKVWQNLLAQVSPLVYNFAKLRFEADEDSCSEFYIFLYPKLEKILSQAIADEPSFSFYFAKAMRLEFLHFYRDNKRRSDRQSADIAVSQLVHPSHEKDDGFSDMERVLYYSSQRINHDINSLARMLDQRLEQGEFEPDQESGQKSDSVADSSSVRRAISLALQQALLVFDPLQQALIKVYYGLDLEKSDLLSLLHEKGDSNQRQMINLWIDSKKRLMSAKNLRQSLLQKLNQLRIIEGNRPLTTLEKKRRNKLVDRYWLPDKGLSIRQLAQACQLSKSRVHRSIEFFVNEFRKQLAQHGVNISSGKYLFVEK